MIGMWSIYQTLFLSHQYRCSANQAKQEPGETGWPWRLWLSDGVVEVNVETTNNMRVDATMNAAAALIKGKEVFMVDKAPYYTFCKISWRHTRSLPPCMPCRRPKNSVVDR